MSKTSKNIIHKRMAAQRKKIGLSQLELAVKLVKLGLRLDRAAIAKIETGIRLVKDYELVALSKALKTTTTWLLFGRNHPV